MSLLIFGDSNVERIWLQVRNNREMLRTATFVPVKRLDQLTSGYQALNSSVICSHLLIYQIQMSLSFNSYLVSRLEYFLNG